ncbi:unnamed protein product [Clavelina lepadiformis]|uniref:Uncharacterized protein n=1 Tax=Clavelina lepadiformis TaxID=159417 RepID=A0ABP0F8R0_CLALP
MSEKEWRRQKAKKVGYVRRRPWPNAFYNQLNTLVPGGYIRAQCRAHFDLICNLLQLEEIVFGIPGINCLQCVFSLKTVLKTSLMAHVSVCYSRQIFSKILLYKLQSSSTKYGGKWSKTERAFKKKQRTVASPLFRSNITFPSRQLRREHALF